jgi:predicted RND superfamily exporter protein
MPHPTATASTVGNGRDRISSAVDVVGRWAVAHRLIVLVGGILLCAVSFWGASRIRVETDYLHFFSVDSVFRVDNTRIAEALGGTQPIYVSIEGDGPGSMAHLDALAAMRDLQQFVREQPGVDGSLSLADYVAIMQGALNPERGRTLPDSQQDVDQLLLFVNPTDVAPVVSRDYGRANVIVRTRLSGSSEVAALVDRIAEYAQSRFRRGIEVRPTGSMVLLNRSADDLSRGQVSGLWQVLAMLLLIMSLIFTSIRAGLLSLVPNVIPIIVLFGIMGWAGIPLNISTSMIAVIAIGIAVDDTITTSASSTSSSAPPATRSRRSQRRAGRRQADRLLGVGAHRGFAITCFSNFQPIRHFGILASSTVAIGLVAELLITPALVMCTTIITLWDLLFLKLGPEPEKQIPLFAGLRPLQAKIVVLMGRLAAADPGELIHPPRRAQVGALRLAHGHAEVRHSPGEPVIRIRGSRRSSSARWPGPRSPALRRRGRRAADRISRPRPRLPRPPAAPPSTHRGQGVPEPVAHPQRPAGGHDEQLARAGR